MASAWNILVVDDEVDVHKITQLALRGWAWNDRNINLTFAASRAEAEALLGETPTPSFDVALVDVVMESEDAGLKLCEYIRAHQARSLRIILRTGQPGRAPEERVMRDYDIDQYLPKGDLTQERLRGALRTSLRVSQDIATVLAMAEQLKGFAAVLQDAATLDEIGVVMAKALGFLEHKYAARAFLFANLSDGACITAGGGGAPAAAEVRADIAAAAGSARAGGAIVTAQGRVIVPFQAGRQRGGSQVADELGMIQRLKAALVKHPAQAVTEAIDGALVLDFSAEQERAERASGGISYDAQFFVGNWCLAYNTVLLQRRIAESQVRKLHALESGAGDV